MPHSLRFERPATAGNQHFTRVLGAGTLIGLLLAAVASPGRASAACGEFPLADCRQAPKSSLVVQQKGGDKDKVVWKWIKGAATSTADLGTPDSTTDYEFCLYSSSHSSLVAEIVVPADGAKWSANAKGYKYKDAAGSAAGLQKATLVAGDGGAAKILVKGKGVNLPDPTLPADLPLRAQWVNAENGTCWEDTYGGSQIKKNQTKNGISAFKGKGAEEDPSAVFPELRFAPPLPSTHPLVLGVPDFVGAPAVANPLPPLMLPDHPILDNEGDSRIHNDAFNSAVYNRDGPLGSNLTVDTLKLTAGDDISNICAMMAFSNDGYLIAVCIRGFVVPTFGGGTNLYMLDPVTLGIYAEVEAAPRPLVQNAAGGAYFSLDQQDRIIIGPANNRIEIWEIEVHGGTPYFVLKSAQDIAADLPSDAMLQDTVVDWDGRVWFASITGEVGYYDPATADLEIYDTGEGLQNSFSVDSTGVYVVTFDAMHKYSVDVDGSILQDWRVPYDNTGPGLVQPGSGTPPTLFGAQNDLVGFADTALPQVNMVVLDRTTGAQVCLTPVFRPNESGAENTFIGYGDEVVVVNNGGFPGVFGPQRDMFPGLEKYTVRADRTGCDADWINDTSFGNSAQLSTTTGLIYGWGPDPSVPNDDAYYMTATDWNTGQEVFRKYAGDGINFNPVAGQMHLHPDGYAFLGSLHGITRLADGP
jgi:hypothetical protein